MRVLLTNYLRDKDEPAKINELIGKWQACSRMLFDEWVGIEASVLEENTIESLRPYVYRCVARELKEPYFIKVQDAWSYTERGEPIFPKDVTTGVIYTLRNPLDIAVSYSSLSGVRIEKMVKNLCDPDFKISTSLQGLKTHLPVRLSSWSEHVQSWVDKSKLPVHIVRYEDLLEDTEKAFGDVVRFCGLSYDAAHIRKAVSFSKFIELQKQEKKIGFCEHLRKSATPFFRSGKTNLWQNNMSFKLVNKMIKMHGKTMKRFGYL